MHPLSPGPPCTGTTHLGIALCLILDVGRRQLTQDLLQCLVVDIEARPLGVGGGIRHELRICTGFALSSTLGGGWGMRARCACTSLPNFIANENNAAMWIRKGIL